MSTSEHNAERGLAALRWGALIVGGLFVVMVIVLNIAGARVGPLAPIEAIDVLQLLGMLATWVGVFVAWKWPLTGAGLIIGGYLFFEGMTYVKVGHFAGRLFLLFPAIAVAYLVYWGLRRRKTA